MYHLEEEWLDLFALIGLGHYDVSEAQIQDGLDYYNIHAKKSLSNITEVVCNAKEQYDRLNTRLTFMKKEAFDWCTRDK